MKKILSLFAAVSLAVSMNAAAPANVEYVDLGLPSGTMWATFNVGATAPEGYGDYFAWGETEPYYADKTTDPITWKNGKESGYNIPSYCNADEFAEWSTPPYDATTKTLKPEFDAATANWGSDWRTPTKADWEELLAECTWVGDTVSGIKGFFVYNKKDLNKSIFLPISGWFAATMLSEVQVNGYYWSSSLDKESSEMASYLFISMSHPIQLSAFPRVVGYAIRPVCNPAEPAELPRLDADKAAVRKYIKDGRFEMEINDKKYNALGF